MVKVDTEGLEKLVKQEQKRTSKQKVSSLLSVIFSIGTGIMITAAGIFDYIYQSTKEDYFPVVAMIWAAGCYYIGWRSYQDYRSVE